MQNNEIHIQYGNMGCQVAGEDTKLATFLIKNQLTKRKLLYFVNRHSGPLAKGTKIGAHFLLFKCLLTF